MARVAKESSSDERPTGKMTVYSQDGEIIWEKEDYHVGYDTIPRGFAYAPRGHVAATQVTDKSGKVLAVYDPDKLLGSARA